MDLVSLVYISVFFSIFKTSLGRLSESLSDPSWVNLLPRAMLLLLQSIANDPRYEAQQSCFKAAADE